MTFQKYLTPEQIAAEMTRVQLRHPWIKISMFRHPFEGYQNVCLSITFTAPDAYHPEETRAQCVNVPVPPIACRDHFHDWLLWRLQTIAVHEMCEMYWVDGAPMFDPHSEQYWAGKDWILFS